MLAGYTPTLLNEADELKQAAVAMVLRDRVDDLEMLFIRRAEHPRDPWSGHMAFPGGRVDPEDQDARSAAQRETIEELSLDLESDGELLGRLSDLYAYGRGERLSMFVQPYVFALHADPPLIANEEVSESLWIPMSFLADRSRRSMFEYTSHRTGETWQMPCYRYEGRLIWGLTFYMLDEFLELAVPSGADPAHALDRRGPIRVQKSG